MQASMPAHYHLAALIAVSDLACAVQGGTERQGDVNSTDQASSYNNYKRSDVIHCTDTLFISTHTSREQDP